LSVCLRTHLRERRLTLRHMPQADNMAPEVGAGQTQAPATRSFKWMQRLPRHPQPYHPLWDKEEKANVFELILHDSIRSAQRRVHACRKIILSDETRFQSLFAKIRRPTIAFVRCCHREYLFRMNLGLKQSESGPARSSGSFDAT
jgi:hypothetical protein